MASRCDPLPVPPGHTPDQTRYRHRDVLHYQSKLLAGVTYSLELLICREGNYSLRKVLREYNEVATTKEDAFVFSMLGGPCNTVG